MGADTHFETVDLQPMEIPSIEGEAEDRRRSDHLAATHHLASCIAHEVNNPAAYVAANLSALRELLVEIQQLVGHAPAAIQKLVEARDIVQDNLHGIGRITSIIRSLKDFSEVEADQIAAVNVNEVVNSACSIVYNQVRHRARVIKSFGDVPEITADPGKLRQAVLNLILNASDAIEEGAADQHFVEIRTGYTHGKITISVRDSGPGIPTKDQERIFEPFYSTKEGTGLGLTVVADIARLHSGSVHVVSHVGRGSRFDLVIPEVTGLHSIGPVRRRQPSVTVTDATPLGGRILLIDDEQMLLKAYRRMLAPSFTVVTAAGGTEALELLRYDPNFDVVICDMMMPQVDGPMIYEELKQRVPELLPRVIFCSGGAFTTRARQFANSVDNLMLEKPVSNADLRGAIYSVLKGTAAPARDTLAHAG